MKSLTGKQEAFVNKFHQCGNASEAYRHAYNTKNMQAGSIHSEGYELLKNPQITHMLSELQEISAERNAITIDSLTKELVDAWDMAREQGLAHTMITSTMAKAKIHGIGLERKVITGKDGSSLMPAGLTVTFID